MLETFLENTRKNLKENKPFVIQFILFFIPKDMNLKSNVYLPIKKL
jgi:hypothetical protein